MLFFFVTFPVTAVATIAYSVALKRKHPLELTLVAVGIWVAMVALYLAWTVLMWDNAMHQHRDPPNA